MTARRTFVVILLMAAGSVLIYAGLAIVSDSGSREIRSGVRKVGVESISTAPTNVTTPRELRDATPTQESESPLGANRSVQASSWPEDVENRIWQFLGANQDLSFTSIEKVECLETTCEIAFTGLDNVASDEFFERITVGLFKEFPMARQGGSAKVEIAPGVYSTVVGISTTAHADAIRDASGR